MRPCGSEANANGAMSTVAIVGAGAWGTALAVTLTRNGHSVVLCVRRAVHLEALLTSRENVAYLPGVRLPPSLGLTSAPADAVSSSEVVVIAVPSQYARGTMVPIAPAIRPGALLISVAKGIEQDSLKTMSQMLAELAPPERRVAVVSGPGFALEITQGKPAALVSAAHDDNVARQVQSIFAARPLRIYRSSDVFGVELGGAVKNVIAIAAGISDGLELGSSARAALITRGLAEMMRLADATGAKPATMTGLAGLGDLVLTCTGALSRNRRVGLGIARGGAVPTSADGEQVAEGVSNARAVQMLADRVGVEMPIVSAVYRVLYEGTPAHAMVEQLLSRELKAEF
jgi:glycerol-3-phosphate dehydrogenase (NAD(P)+)